MTPNRCSAGRMRLRKAGIGLVAWISSPGIFGQASTNALPPLAPPYGELRPGFWEQHGIGVLVASVAVLAAVGVGVWLFVRPVAPVVTPPAARAREALGKLLRQSQTDLVIGEISQILRVFLAETLHLPAVEMTTAELAETLGHRPDVPPKATQALTGFLRECDQRKFGPANPADDFDAAARALEIVSEIEQRPAGPVVQN